MMRAKLSLDMSAGMPERPPSPVIKLEDAPAPSETETIATASAKRNLIDDYPAAGSTRQLPRDSAARRDPASSRGPPTLRRTWHGTRAPAARSDRSVASSRPAAQTMDRRSDGA